MIGEAITVNDTLRELDMCCCSIGCAAADFIAQALSKNLSLQNLIFLLMKYLMMVQ